MPLSRLAIELKKKRPFELPEEEAYLNLIRSAQWLQHGIDRLLRQYGLSEATYNVLRILRGAGAEGLPCIEIGQRMVTRVPDVTRLVDRLIANDLATRRRIESDRRVVQVTITANGLKRLADLDKPMTAIVKRQLSGLTKSEMVDLIRLLEKARDGVSDPCEAER